MLDRATGGADAKTDRQLRHPSSDFVFLQIECLYYAVAQSRANLKGRVRNKVRMVAQAVKTIIRCGASYEKHLHTV
jgi:hypothetical protein